MDIQSETTRDRILRRVTEKLARSGLAGTGLRDLAAAAGVSHRTLLYHFGSRDELVLEALGELRDTTGESVQLYVADGDARVCIAALESPHGLRTIVPLGAALPLSVGSAGRALTADPAALTRPWVATVGEREPGVASVSAPVVGGDGRVVAAVGVSGPVGRTGRQPGRRYGEAVAAAARRIERDAGLGDGLGDGG